MALLSDGYAGRRLDDSGSVNQMEAGARQPPSSQPPMCREEVWGMNDKIWVCDNCLCACCWAGIFYCDRYREAGIVLKSKDELRKLNREHPSYWELEEVQS